MITTSAKPLLSDLYKSREPSAIRLAQIEFAERKAKGREKIDAVNVAIGNVSLPMHPAMLRRMKNLFEQGSPFNSGVVKYTPTVGNEETRRAFLNIIASSGFKTDKLYIQVTDGGSAAMELVVLGVTETKKEERALLVIEPVYANYVAFARRLGRPIISISRELNDEGSYRLPSIEAIEEVVKEKKPGGILVIPYDNPTGQLYSYQMMKALANISVKYNLWLVSDEAYRELYYGGSKENSKRPMSIWGITEEEVPGITGRRISIESASKVWNACGLRIGALVTDSAEFHRRSVAEYTANLCPNAIGQYIFGALAHESHTDLNSWYEKQRRYYKEMIESFHSALLEKIPGLIVSAPASSLYSVVDVRNVVKEDFDAKDFVMYCARNGKVEIEGNYYTLLVAPMEGFYGVTVKSGANSHSGRYPWKTQMRIAYVETPERMKLVPELFSSLLNAHLKK